VNRVPLARALSKLGLATRTEARRLILDGRVEIDGHIVRDPAHLVVPEKAAIRIDGRTARRSPRLTILLHKPRGVVTTRRDPEGRPTVYSLLTDLDAHVVPVGRLDLASSGVLILTNDTKLSDWLTDPANEIPRIYVVSVRGRFTPDDARALTDGRRFEGELLQARQITIRKASGRESLIIVELTEGKNREIRRMMKAINHEVTALKRVQFGGLTLDGVNPGAWRRISDDELVGLFPGAPISRLRSATRRV
jgi:23S rRNA pseudouridine2605 synthase